MKPPSARDVLKSFGLSAAELGEAQHLTWPEAPVGHAKGLTTVVTLAAMLSAEAPDTTPASIEALDRLGIQVRALAGEPHRLKFSSAAPGEAIQVRMLEGNAEAIAQQPEHPDVVAVDTARAGPFLLAVGEGRALLIPAERGIDVHPILTAPDLRPFEAISAPIAEWIAGCDDQWLVAEVRTLVAAGDVWSVATAVGMYARLLEPDSTAIARDRLRAVLGGQVDPELARPRAWARSLSTEQISTLERLALAEIDRLYEQLDSVTRAAESNQQDWQGDWIRACRAREAIEGVALLLSEAGRSTVRHALDSLDREGKRTRLGISLRGLPTDERLRRASLRDPFCWWGQVI